MSKDVIKVEKIRIQIGKMFLELKPDELRELRDVLNATFPAPTTINTGYPIYIERPLPSPWRHWEPYWCEAGTADTPSGTLTFNCMATEEAHV